VTRAVHLELVPDLSARSFLLAFRRFAARRGPVLVMYSDNAQTFRCVSRHLNILQADPSVQDLLARRNLLWIFSASLAPWWGGFWERMVRSVKDLLRRSNGRACLAYDELEASLIEIESVINARPLNYIGEGADDPLPITPNQFLNNRRSTCATPEPAVNLLAPPTIDPAPAGPVEPIADPALIVPELPDPVAAEVEPNGTGSGGEHDGNLPTRTTRSGRKSRPPQHLADDCLRGPR
jgi:hypothetical protein